MKFILISALVCLAGCAHAATIQRIARNTEAIIPTIVEEILKVELQSDLKKNSAVDAIEEEPIVKAIEKEVEAIASRTVEDGAIPVEEKKPEIVEIVAVPDIVAEPLPSTRNTEPLPEIVEKIEIVSIKEPASERPIEKPLDNFRTETAPLVELPMEIIKETVVIAPIDEIRQEPVIAIIKEEEIVKPMVRNVIKEEIPQVEELRNIAVAEKDAVKEEIPEPVASSNIVEPVVEVVQQVRTVASEPLKEMTKEPALVEMKLEAELVKPEAPFIKAELPLIKTEILEALPEMKIEEPVKKIEVEMPLKEEIKEEKIELAEPIALKEIPEIKTEVKEEIIAAPAAAPALEAAAPSVDENDAQIRQDRPTIVQQVQDAVVNAVGQVFNRNPAVPAADDAAILDESATTSRPNLIQQAITGVQTFVQNTQQNLQNVINPAASNSAESGDTTARPNPLQIAVQAFQGAVQNVQNLVSRPTTAATPAASEAAADAEPAKVEEKPKSVEPEEIKVAVEPAAVQKEVAEPQKIVEGEKENLVKNWNQFLSLAN